MRRYWGIGLITLLVLLVAGSRALDPRCREPVYGGKTLSQWLDGGYEQASMALQEIGPSAAPFILAKLSREDALEGSLRVRRALWSKMPLMFRNAFPKPRSGNFDEWRACSALLELGPRVVPFLASRLGDRQSVVREASAHALASLRERGADIRLAALPLSRALVDPTPGVRMWAGQALGNLRDGGNHLAGLRESASNPGND